MRVLHDRELEEVRKAVLVRSAGLRERASRLEEFSDPKAGAGLVQEAGRPPRRIPVAVGDVYGKDDVVTSG